MNKSKVVNTKRDRRSAKNPSPSSAITPNSSFLTIGALVTGLSSSLGKMTEEIDVKVNPIVPLEITTLVHDDETPTLSESSTVGDSGMSSDVTITNDDVSSISIDDKQTKIAEIDSTTLKKGQNSRSSTESFDTQSITDVKPSTGKNKSKRTSLKKQLQNLLKIEKSSIHDDLPILDEQTNGKKSIINGKSSSTNKKNSTEDTSVNNGLLTDATPIVENVRSSSSPATSPRRPISTSVKEIEEKEEVKPMSTGVSDSISSTTIRTSIRSSSVEADDRQRSPARSYDTGLSSSYSVSHQTGNAQATDNLRVQRQREREELSELNDRFRGYLDRVKILENKNSVLTSQLDEISKTWGAASKSIINQFGTPLDRLRQELNDCMMDEADFQTGLRRSQQTIDHYRQLINDEAAWNDRQEEKREQLKLEFDHSCSELNSLKNSYKQVEDQIKYLLKQRDDHISKVDDLNERFYQATIDRIKTDLQVQTLREEIPFLNDIYSHLLSEFEQLKPTNGLDAQLFYRQELEKAIRDIRRDFETLNNAQRKEMEDYYALKITEMQNEAKKLPIQSIGVESSKASDQNKSFRNDLNDTQKLLIQEKNKFKDLQDLLAKLEEEFAFVRDQRLDANESMNRELSQAQENVQQLTTEIDTILRGNITLESEINIYRRLLDSETKRLPQAPVETISVPEPAPASFGSELGKVFNKKIKKGPISIKDCAPDGKCITLDNSSHDRDVDVSNWVLKRCVDGGQELTYTIPVGLVIQSGGELKIFARSAQNAHNRLPYQVVNDKLDSWGMGTECVTKLFNDQGEDKASHEQKIVFGSDSARTIPYDSQWPM